MTPDKIRDNLARLRTVERERDVFTTENKALTRQLANKERELKRYTGDAELLSISPQELAQRSLRWIQSMILWCSMRVVIKESLKEQKCSSIAMANWSAR
jgi:hypothetical protein